jgi:hypothetical protein
MATHPYTVPAIAELPEALRQQAATHVPAGEQAHCIFVVPRAIKTSIYHRPRLQPEQALLFTQSGVLWIQEDDLEGRFPAPVFVRASQLVSMTLSLILLYGKLEIIGVGEDGRRAEIVLEYNTVRHHKLQPALARFLAQSAQRCTDESPDPLRERQAGEDLRRLHLKYRNGLTIYALGQEERLREIAFQPAIRVPIWLGFHRTLVHPTLLALTNQHLILLGEEQANRENDYGWVITFCPLSVIQEVQTVAEQQHQRLIVRLGCGQVEVTHGVTFETAQEERVEGIVDRVRSVAAWQGAPGAQSSS